jgi:succinyl-diaminopimelate desuccinylase
MVYFLIGEPPALQKQYPMGDTMKQQLLALVERDRELILSFIQDFVRCKSPNPPGDTRSSAKHVGDFLRSHGHDFEEISGHPDMPNLVATTRFNEPGKHLVLNGHMDVFPVTGEAKWTKDPWGGERSGGSIYGRGVCDMKVGTSAAIFTYHYLSQVADRLKGRVSLVAVSDEETFGPWGARYLFEHHLEKVRGDCCLIGEPSSPHTVRFGEKGVLWMRFLVHTKGAHGAYTHASENAIALAGKVIEEVLKITELPAPEPDNLSAALDAAAQALDDAYGVGAARNVRRITANVGTMQAGTKVNMVPSEASFEIDFRIPNGFTDDVVAAHVAEILARNPQLRAERILYNPPSWSAPDHEMVRYVRRNARRIFGLEPVPVVGLAGTDARLWRYHDVPAVVFGPYPEGMASHDERVSEDDAIKLVKTHLACAWDYLTGPTP